MKSLFGTHAHTVRAIAATAGTVMALSGLALTGNSAPAYALEPLRGPLNVTTTPLPEPTTPPPPTNVPPGATPNATRPPGSEPTATPEFSIPRPNPPDPYVQLSGCVVSCVNPGEIAELTAVVGNKGGTSAVNVQARFNVPAGYELVDVTPSGGTVINNGASVIVDIGTLNPTDVITIKIRLRVKADAAPGSLPVVVTLNTTSGGDVSSNNVSYAECQVCKIVLPETGRAGGDNSAAIALTVLGISLLSAGALSRRRTSTSAR
jgi:hypothetical protein